MYRKYFSEQIFYFTYERNPASAGQPTYYIIIIDFSTVRWQVYFDNFYEKDITCTTRLI